MMSLEAYTHLRQQGPTVKLNFRGQATEDKINQVISALRDIGMPVEERLRIEDQAVVFVPENGAPELVGGTKESDAMMDLILRWMRDPDGFIEGYQILAYAKSF